MKKSLLKNPFNKEQWLAILSEIMSDPTTQLTHATSVNIPLTKVIDAVTKGIPVPQIAITSLAFLKMMTLVQRSSQEIAWHGIVEKKGNDIYLITDILMYPQTATSTTVDADEEKYTPWLMQNHAVLNDIRMQGHSHVNMGVFASGPDTAYYTEMVSHTNDYYIFLIVNKKWEIHSRFYDCQKNVLFEDLPVLIAGKNSFDLTAWATEQLAMVSPKSYPTTPPYRSYPVVETEPTDYYNGYGTKQTTAPPKAHKGKKEEVDDAEPKDPYLNAVYRMTK